MHYSVYSFRRSYETVGTTRTADSVHTIQDAVSHMTCLFAKSDLFMVSITQAKVAFIQWDLYYHCWEGYFGNVIGYRLQVTLLKM